MYWSSLRHQETPVPDQHALILQQQQVYDSDARPQYTVYPNNGSTYENYYDAFGRPTALRHYDSATTLINGITYNPAGQITEITNMLGHVETHTYNSLQQLTRLTDSLGGVAQIDFQYNFSSTQNNGRITSMKDWVTGEEVTYGYDALQRLTKAETVGPQWGQAFVYDGWGNLVQKNATKGSVPVFQLTADPATNRLSSRAYDNNGNDITGGLSYDVANRLTGAGGITYGYSGDNRRVLKRSSAGVETYTFWSITGQRLGDYTLNGATWTTVSTNLYFHGRLIQSNGQTVITDRLGSNVAGGKRYYPYGEERGSPTPDNAEKFATYYRDGESGLDYADQRYSASQYGRFTTPDPLASSGSTSDPNSLGRYAYTSGDPVTRVDPNGLDFITVTSCWRTQVTWSDGSVELGLDINCDQTTVFSGAMRDLPLLAVSNIYFPSVTKLLGLSTNGLNHASSVARQVATTDFSSKGDCMKLMTALANQSGTGMTVSAFVARLKETAAAASSALFDGEDDATPFDQSKFPGAGIAGVRTVGDWFDAVPGAQALSQYNGNAIFIRASNWGTPWSPYVNGYGHGIILHEVLHKQWFGFSPFDSSHQWFSSALRAAGLTSIAPDYANRNYQAEILRKLCF